MARIATAVPLLIYAAALALCGAAELWQYSNARPFHYGSVPWLDRFGMLDPSRESWSYHWDIPILKPGTTYLPEVGVAYEVRGRKLSIFPTTGSPPTRITMTFGEVRSGQFVPMREDTVLLDASRGAWAYSTWHVREAFARPSFPDGLPLGADFESELSVPAFLAALLYLFLPGVLAPTLGLLAACAAVFFIARSLWTRAALALVISAVALRAAWSGVPSFWALRGATDHAGLALAVPVMLILVPLAFFQVVHAFTTRLRAVEDLLIGAMKTKEWSEDWRRSFIAPHMDDILTNATGTHRAWLNAYDAPRGFLPLFAAVFLNESRQRIARYLAADRQEPHRQLELARRLKAGLFPSTAPSVEHTSRTTSRTAADELTRSIQEELAAMEARWTVEDRGKAH